MATIAFPAAVLDLAADRVEDCSRAHHPDEPERQELLVLSLALRAAASPGAQVTLVPAPAPALARGSA